MPDKDSKSSTEIDLQRYLEQARDLRAGRKSDPHSGDYLVLKAWQSQRLAGTYADLLGNPRYRPAAEFFLADLYGTKDFGPRDKEVARVMPMMRRMLPMSALKTIADALNMDSLSESLDNDMVAALRTMNCTDRIDGDIYGQAYRRCDRKPDRELQIELIEKIGSTLDRLTRMPLLHSTLKLMRKPAELAGLDHIQSFLERGFDAFKHMGAATEFLAIINDRETALMRQLFQETALPAPADDAGEHGVVPERS